MIQNFTFAAGLLLLVSAASAESVDDLRKRANDLDNIARALIGMARCSTPKTFDPNVLGSMTEQGVAASTTRSFGTEVEQLMREPRILSEIPATNTRACLYLAENFGRGGRLVAGLVITDTARIEVQNQEAIQAAERRQREAIRDKETQQRQAEASAQSSAEDAKAERATFARKAYVARYGENRRDNIGPWFAECIKFAKLDPNEIVYASGDAVAFTGKGKQQDVAISILVSTDKKFENPPRVLKCKGKGRDGGLTITDVE